jgi:small subunit ribosomal protein S8e
MRWQGKAWRKPTGGRVKLARKKRLSELGRDVLLPRLGKPKRKNIRTRGGNKKIVLLGAEVANVTDRKTGKTARVKIQSVIANPANPHWVRRNIITKGAIIQTDLGRARVTSRPGQVGMVNAVLIPEPKQKRK